MERTNLTLDKLTELGGQLFQIDDTGKTTSVPVNKILLSIKEKEGVEMQENSEIIALFFPNSNKIHGLFLLKREEDNAIYKILHNPVMVQ